MSAITDKTSKLLQSASSILAKQQVLVGLDGFVDQIIRVVDKRTIDGNATFVPQIPEWGKRIIAAGGKSTKFELSVQQTKLGGNGPIMAQALASYGLPMHCVGNLGWPEVHPVFIPMKARCKVTTIADASYTDAIEFEDGKIMLSRQETAALVTWETMEKVFGAENLFKLFDDASFMALNNWTALPHMIDIWKKLQAKVCPKLKGDRKKIFFDLADPEFRIEGDIREALETISKFQTWFDAILGLNQKESATVCSILGLKVDGDDRTFCRRAAEAIREKLGVYCVVVHAVAFATAASKEGSALLDGPYVAKPLISTGAGDHFNAGFSLGMILGGDLESCLQIGVGTSGFYVRTAKSPDISDMQGFLKEIA